MTQGVSEPLVAQHGSQREARVASSYGQASVIGVTAVSFRVLLEYSTEAGRWMRGGNTVLAIARDETRGNTKKGCPGGQPFCTRAGPGSVTAEDEPEAMDDARGRPLDALIARLGKDASVLGSAVEPLGLRRPGEQVLVPGEVGVDLEVQSREGHCCLLSVAGAQTANSRAF